MQRFEHRPLDFNKDQIRLVRILDDDASGVACEIEVFFQSECPEYQALSYTWGSPTPVHSIKLNGKDFPVRENLWSFLYHVTSKSIRPARSQEAREESPSPESSPAAFLASYYWIDQVCIDQNSTDERSHRKFCGVVHTFFGRCCYVILPIG